MKKIIMISVLLSSFAMASAWADAQIGLLSNHSNGATKIKLHGYNQSLVNPGDQKRYDLNYFFVEPKVKILNEQNLVLASVTETGKPCQNAAGKGGYLFETAFKGGKSSSQCITKNDGAFGIYTVHVHYYDDRIDLGPY